uniref:Prohibitin n=1 Tax=Strongyloides papillosus TaxID=174720 RepID=A0A0N5B243_STREA
MKHIPSTGKAINYTSLNITGYAALRLQVFRTLKSANLEVYFADVECSLISSNATNVLKLSIDQLVKKKIDALKEMNDKLEVRNIDEVLHDIIQDNIHVAMELGPLTVRLKVQRSTYWVHVNPTKIFVKKRNLENCVICGKKCNLGFYIIVIYI